MPVIRQTRQMFNKPIGVRSFDTGGEQVGRAVSNLADTMGREFYERAAKKAKKAGVESAQSLSKDELLVFDPETGKPKPMSSTDGMGSIARDAFEDVVERRFVDAVDKDIRLKSAELASKYEDPSQYEGMFSSYLDSLSSGADDRFKNLIVDSGSFLMASTKIKLADAARARSRAAAAQSIKTTNAEMSEVVFDTAAGGDPGASALILNERFAAAQEGENAGLFKAGYAAAVASDLAVQGMSGALQVAMQDATPLQQSSINLYISTQGRSGGDALTEKQKSNIDHFIGYVDRNNTRSILSESNLIASSVNSVRDAQIAEQEAIFAAQSKKLLLNFESGSVTPARFNSAQLTQNAWRQGDQRFVGGSVGTISREYERQASQLKSAFASDAISLDQYNSLDTDQRRAALDSIVIGMATDGNIEELKVAFVTQSPEDIAKLSSLQQVAFQSLQKTSLYNASDDRNYIKTLLSGTQNDVQDRIDKEVRNANLFVDVGNVSTDFLNGSFSPETIQEVEARAADALTAGDITANEFSSLTEGVRAAAGKGVANIASGNMTSLEMTALANYVASGGEETAGVNPFVASAGNAILSTVPDAARPSVVNHINGVREKLEKKERTAEAVREEEMQRARVIGGGGQVTSASDRKLVDEILQKAGVDITDPSSKNDDFYSLIRSAPPQSLVDSLSAISLGVFVPGAEVLLDHWAVMSSDATGEGVFINRFGTGDGAAISPTKSAILQDIVNIRKFTGGDVNEIAMTLIERRNDPKSDVRLKQVFGDQSPKEYVSEIYGEVIAAELSDVAEYYARTGQSKGDIKDRLKEMVDTRFIKSHVVVDPRFPMGRGNITSSSLEATLPNEDRRDEFVRLVNERLPAGFELARKESNRARSKRAAQGVQSVYLVPTENTAGPSYLAHVLENDVLVPLFVEVNGEVTWPLFDEDVLRDFDEISQVNEQARLEGIADQAEEVRLAVDAKPGLRSLEDIGSLSIKETPKLEGVSNNRPPLRRPGYRYPGLD